ncbi:MULTISPECIES: hypothetical protein [unclassified Janthinobacterium]|uniref:hypothetical protein n=1 Tax=unclassified Janthinobacterium TaxID=2610881 RepID=UPI0003477F3B|nr:MULTISPECIES: hypothetical protein [unclassified Janthinobacterium]MEC5162761.1 hypothetical protein [Janthinobacterium sp. CG_S6]
MLKCFVFSMLALAGAAAGAAPSGLTEQERGWLRAGAAVLEYARQIKLPVDIIVQPQPAPGAVPLAMGFDGGRCKLVLSMRENPQTELVLAALPRADHALMIEAMTAHEIGHCWRYAHGEWHALPAGFVETGEEFAGNPELLRDAKGLRDTRREEGFADLVALAWIQLRHPNRYVQVYDWLAGVRREGSLSGGSHDTLAWLNLARDGAAFTPAATPFDQVGALWGRGLTGDK